MNNFDNLFDCLHVNNYDFEHVQVVKIYTFKTIIWQKHVRLLEHTQKRATCALIGACALIRTNMVSIGLKGLLLIPHGDVSMMEHIVGYNYRVFTGPLVLWCFIRGKQCDIQLRFISLVHSDLFHK